MTSREGKLGVARITTYDTMMAALTRPATPSMSSPKRSFFNTKKSLWSNSNEFEEVN
jgi:hypothetical protein